MKYNIDCIIWLNKKTRPVILPTIHFVTVKINVTI